MKLYARNSLVRRNVQIARSGISLPVSFWRNMRKVTIRCIGDNSGVTLFSRFVEGLLSPTASQHIVGNFARLRQVQRRHRHLHPIHHDLGRDPR